MFNWRLFLFSLFVLFGLVSTRLVLKPVPTKPMILADVTNSATVNIPTATPTTAPTTAPTSSPTTTPTSTPTSSPTGATTPTPTTSLTPTLTLSITPTPTTSLTASPTPIIHLALQPTPTAKEPKETYITYSLFGYTSSYANVRLEGIKLLEGTKASKNGYFEFINFKASSLNQEFCLLSVDSENLISPPLCVPVPTSLGYDDNRYGPYLLPPTIRLDKGSVETGQQTVISGKTIPGANVNMHLFDQPGKSLVSRIFKPVLAAPSARITPGVIDEVVELKTAADGSFSTKVVGKTSGKKRVFAQAAFSAEGNSSKTPKSTTLTINVLSAFLALLLEFFGLFRKLFSLNLLLLIQFGIVFWLILRHKRVFSWLHLHQQKQRAIVLYRQKTSLAVAEKNYCPLENHLEEFN
jgi:hypothetical protein